MDYRVYKTCAGVIMAFMFVRELAFVVAFFAFENKRLILAVWVIFQVL